MSIEIKVPRPRRVHLGGDAGGRWLKPDGAAVRLDEPMATLETDKANMAAVEIVTRDGRAR